MGVNLSFGDKTYKFFNDSVVNKAYERYKSAGIPVLKCQLRNGNNVYSALMTEGKFIGNNFYSNRSLLNGDVIGAQNGSNSKPLFTAKNRVGSLYSFIRLSQGITFTYKYQNIESWTNSIYLPPPYDVWLPTGSPSRSRQQILTIVSWESLFPLEGDYVCSLGNVAFNLPAGHTSGTINKSGTYYSGEPKNGVNCRLLYGDLSPKNYTENFYSIQSRSEIYGKTALASDRTRAWKEYFLWFWNWHVEADWQLTWLDASDPRNIHWNSRTIYGDEHIQDANEWWAGKKPAAGEFKTTSFTTITGSEVFNKNGIKFNETYIVNAVRGPYGSSGESHEWKSYTQVAVYGSANLTDRITFSFAYSGD